MIARDPEVREVGRRSAIIKYVFALSRRLLNLPYTIGWPGVGILHLAYTQRKQLVSQVLRRLEQCLIYALGSVETEGIMASFFRSSKNRFTVLMGIWIHG